MVNIALWRGTIVFLGLSVLHVQFSLTLGVLAGLLEIIPFVGPVAALLAIAQAAVHAPAKRSLMFLWVCAEEQGLIGSAAYAAAPLAP